MVTSLFEQVVTGEPPIVYRLTTEQYHAMTEAGILPEGGPIELLDGLLICKDRSQVGGDPTRHSIRHASAVAHLQNLSPKIGALGFILLSQLPIRVASLSEPEPDAAVLKWTVDEYYTRFPTASDVLLLIEVAENSLRFDRTIKQRIYATAGIAYYWIVNLQENIIETYSQPDAASGDYTSRRDYTVAETIVTEFAPDKQLKVFVGDIITS